VDVFNGGVGGIFQADGDGQGVDALCANGFLGLEFAVEIEEKGGALADAAGVEAHIGSVMSKNGTLWWAMLRPYIMAEKESVMPSLNG
jgi:hypothetical protein